MSLYIKELNQSEYEKASYKFKDELPIWLNIKFTSCYKNKFLLAAYNGQNIEALWIVPMLKEDNVIAAKREFRFFPYASPYIFSKDNLKRRNVTSHLFSHVIKKCDFINLPFAPGFYDLAPIQELKGFVEMRLTHTLEESLNFENISRRIRNHIRSSNKTIKITSTQNPDLFKFDLAIKGSLQEQNERKKLAMDMLNKNSAITFIALLDDEPISGLFVSYDKHYSYMLHSWQEEKTPRGTMSNLIFEATKWVYSNDKSSNFDFEGSVFQKIDYYYSGFNCKITPYGYIYWAKDKKTLNKLIDNSINIPGRTVINEI